MVECQLRCPSCLLKITIYVDEGASTIFDRQRQVEKPVAAKPVKVKPVKAKPISFRGGASAKVKPIAFRSGTTLWVKDGSKKQKSERFQKRTKK